MYLAHHDSESIDITIMIMIMQCDISMSFKAPIGNVYDSDPHMLIRTVHAPI